MTTDSVRQRRNRRHNNCYRYQRQCDSTLNVGTNCPTNVAGEGAVPHPDCSAPRLGRNVPAPTPPAVVSLSNVPATTHTTARPARVWTALSLPTSCWVRRTSELPSSVAPTVAAGALRCRGLIVGWLSQSDEAGGRSHQPSITCWHSPNRNDAARYRERWGLAGRTFPSSASASSPVFAVGDLVAGLEPRAPAAPRPPAGYVRPRWSCRSCCGLGHDDPAPGDATSDVPGLGLHSG